MAIGVYNKIKFEYEVFDDRRHAWRIHLKINGVTYESNPYPNEKMARDAVQDEAKNIIDGLQ